jgi:ABC-2 type transport system ATP-binding protein
MKLGVAVAGLKKHFGATTALRGLSFEAEGPLIFGVVGPDGAGKTTLLRILTGLMAYDEGEVSVLGLDPARDAARLKPLLGYVPQAFSMYPSLTVDENLEFVARCHGVSRADYGTRRAELLHLARLERFAGYRCEQLSGGMKQKVALCGALLPRPPLIVLDEPTTGVDVHARAEFWNTIRQEASRALVLVSTNYLDEAYRCDRILYMVDGRHVAMGTPREICQSSPVRVYRVIATPRGREAEIAAALARDDGVARAEAGARDVRVETTHPEERLREVLGRLGFAARVEEVEPDLETALLALEQRARAVRPSGERALLQESWWTRPA